MNRLLIVDGHAYAYRAFYAIKNLRSPNGRPTNSIYGFVKMLEKMQLALVPTHLMVVWDGGLSSKRLELLPAYKAQRAPMPDDLRVQLGDIGEYLKAAGVPQYSADGIEADDYIASLAKCAESAGWRVVIASSDKDFMQLVSDRVGLINPNDKNYEVWTKERVKAKTGVGPELVVDWLALMGDAVDNIPGVAGVGPKTAAELLKQFGSLQALLERWGEVKSERLRTAIQNAEAVLRRNVELVKLTQVPCEFDSDKLKVGGQNRVRLAELYASWGFKGMLAALGARSETQTELI